MDILRTEQRSRLMAGIRNRDTKPEMAVRKLTHALGYRYRLHGRKLPGSSDLVFRPRRKIIFVHEMMALLLSTSDQRRQLMSRIKGRNTGPELTLRHAAWKLGLRYRLQYRIGRTRPDMVFIGPKLAVFVDGCFWHGCPQHSKIPKNNREFWEQKLRRNRERDVDSVKWLVSEGWRVLRLWEHDIETSPTACARQIAVMLGEAKE